MSVTNHERLGRAMHALKEGLGPFVIRELEAEYGDDWLAKATSGWHGDTLLRADRSNLDIQALLRLVSTNWNSVFSSCLGRSVRNLVGDVSDWRNAWAHQDPLNNDDAYRALDSAERLLLAVSAPQAEQIRSERLELLGTIVGLHIPQPAPRPVRCQCDHRAPDNPPKKLVVDYSGNDDHERRLTVWRLIAHHERPVEVAEWMRKNGTIAVGWGGTGDLNDLTFGNTQELTRLVKCAYPGLRPASWANGGRSLWRLCRDMRIDDLVIISASSRRAQTMRVTSDYYYDVSGDPEDYDNRREAEIVPIDPDDLWKHSGGRAVGQSPYCTLIRCEDSISETEFAELTGRRHV